MSELIMWFFLAQALSNFPSMQEGTRVQIVSPDLLTIYGEAVVLERALTIPALLTPGSEIKLMISFEGDEDEASVLEVYVGHVSAEGDDILLHENPNRPPVSLTAFLENERNVRLQIVQPQD